MAKTLLQIAGASRPVPNLNEAVTVIVDAQREYVDGAIPLVGIDHALEALQRVIELSRAKGAPIIHIVHHGSAGGAFAPQSAGAEIVGLAAPRTGETVIIKRLPNAFAGTDLNSVLQRSGRTRLILAGFMTHMCVETTARAALDLGYTTFVVAPATATRDLPDPLTGATVAAAEVQRNALAALSDRFATIIGSVNDLI